MYRRHNLAKRRVVLSAAAVYAFTRAFAYLPGVRSEPLQEPLVVATAGGEWLLWLYLAAWGAAGVLCLVNLRTGELRWPVALLCGLMAAWGAAWFCGWVFHPETTWWQTAFTYWCPGTMLATLVALTPVQVRVGGVQTGEVLLPEVEAAFREEDERG